MLSVLAPWNRWGSAKLNAGYQRDITQKIHDFIDTPEVVTLTGLRRAGKTTILYQLMDELEKRDIPQQAMLHINFEEPALAPLLKLELLDDLYYSYRNEVYPKGKAYLFFDEIQNVPEWERWVRTRNEHEDVKIFITGSSAHLMSRELATLLTGRHVNFHISPLSFSEFLKFKNIELPSALISTHATPEIQNALLQYLRWGGLPEIVLSQTDQRRMRLLKQYFDDILFKDVALRHQIRDINALRNIAVYLLTQTVSLVSFNRIANLFQISLEMAKNYCNFLQEAFIIDFLPFYSLKATIRNRNPHKVYACDLGIRQMLALNHSEDNSRLIETAVYHQLQHNLRGDIFYWKSKQEIDFVLRKGNTIYLLIQSVSENIENEKVYKRGLAAFEEAHQEFPKASKLLVVNKMPKLMLKTQLPLTTIPLWKFLLTNE